MDKENQIGLDTLNKTGSGLTEVPWGAPEGAQLQEAPWFEPQATPSVKQSTNPNAVQNAQPQKQGAGISNDKLDAIAQREGLTPAQARIWKEGILAQESGKGANSRTSVDGARGPGQVIPSTFAGYAKPGERVDNEEHNLAVSARIVKDLATKFNDDPARVAVGYFSGEGNVNKNGNQAWKNDAADGNGKRVSSYASDVLRRLESAPQANGSPAPAPDTSKIPRWNDIVAKPEYAKLSPEDQQAAKELYFDHYIAPVAGEDAESLRAEFMAKKASAPAPKQEPGLLDKAGQVVSDIYSQAKKELFPKSVMEGAPAQPTPTDASFAPAKPEVRRAVEAQWDAASPAQRAKMEADPSWVGDIARARAGAFGRQDKALPNSPTLQSVDPRVEARRAELIRKGEDPRFADTAAQEGARKAAVPGQEIAALDGVAQKSDFDFDTQAAFSGDNKLLNNPITRAGAKGALGIAKFGAGYGQFMSDLYGLDGSAGVMKDAGDWVRGKEAAIGERGTMLERNLEGALSSITQQLPLMLVGVKTASEAIPLVGIGMQTFGQEYSDGRAKGQSMGEAATRAGLFAAFEIVGEKFSIGANLKALKAIFDKTPTDQLAGLMWNVIKKEVPSEMLTTTGQFATDKLGGGVGLNPNAGTQEFIAQMGDTIVQTIMQSVIMGGAPGAVKGTRDFLTDKGDESANMVEIRANSAQEQALAKWEQFRQSTRPQNAGRPEPTMGAETPVTVTADGRIEPTMADDPIGAIALTGQQPATATPTPEPQANAISPIVADADQIVSELATQAGIPQDTVLPTPTASTPTVTAPAPNTGAVEPQTDNDVSDLAEVRLDQLRNKRDGGTAMVMTEDGPQEVDQPPTALTPQEARELSILESGDINAIRTLYGANNPVAQATLEPGLVAAQENPNESVQAQAPAQVDGTAPGIAPQNAVGNDGQSGGTAAVQEPAADAASAQVGAEGGQRQQGLSAEDALEREAIQSEADFKPTDVPDIDVPFDPIPTNGTQTPQAQQAETQGSQEAPADRITRKADLPNGMQTHVFKTSDGFGAGLYDADAEQYVNGSIRRFKGEDAEAKATAYADEVESNATPPAPPKTEKEAKQQREAKAPNTDLDAMFDDVLAEETGGKEQEQSPLLRARNDLIDLRSQVEAQGNVVDDRLLERVRRQERLVKELQGETAPKTEREAKEQRTAGEAAASAAKNTVEGFNNAIDGLGKLFGGGPGTLGSGPVFNEETYRKAKPLFQAAVANFQQAGADIREVMRAVVQALLSKFGKQAVENMKPYVVRFISEYQQGDKNEPVSTATDLYTPKGKMKVAQTLADEFIGGASFKTIIEARKRISELIGKPIEAATELAKQADETIEVAVVLAGREIVKAGRAQGRSPQVIYDRLVDLYNRQPNLAVRSSTSVRDQAYSTPVPLAYLASELAGITYDSKVLEPTAGNGMLLVGAATENSTANELNPKRASMLQAMGFDALTENAATEDLADPNSQDAVIANPPFGATKNAKGETIVYEVRPDYGTREVDHAIAFNALTTMKDDGRAVLIVGGTQSTEEEARREDYRGKGKRTFYFNLYNEYNVVDHFTVDGSLYSKQGASYPVDVIVIEGRGKSARNLPAADLPQIIGSYDELKEKLNGTRSVESQGVRSTDRAAGGQDQAGAGNGTAVDRGTGRPSDATGDRGGRGNDAASVPGSRTAGDRQPAGSGTVSGDGQSQSQDTSGSRSDRQAAVPGEGRGTQPGSTASDRGNRPVEVGGERVVAGERVGSGLTDRRGEETETENQVAYEPRSNAASVGTLVPRAMRDSIQNSIAKIEDQFGNIDEFVAEKLEMDVETLRENFSAEQVDALALAIKNAEEGRGFIIGDQTGIGKGRVVAAMIRYALVNGKVPIFVTEKPNLYSDMIRDLDDIGMTAELALDTNKPRIFITNASESIPYTLLRESNGEITETNLTLRAPASGKALEQQFQMHMNANDLGHYKVIFTTYSQLQTVKGKQTTRMNFVKQFGAGNYMIFDESHNAGGAGETQARSKEQRDAAKAGESLVTGRAAFVRQLVNAAFGTFFSSATYAKRPDVMDLYSSTNMKLAVDRISQLGEAIKNGGVPMQQVVANMLTTDGQYIRRERTFAGVSYDTVETKVDKETAENMASAMRAVLAFSRAKEAVIKNIQKEMDKEGTLIKQMGGESSAIQGANFGAIMHNLIDQMLLSLKVQDSINHALERLKAGEKVVMTVSNTMGSFLKDYAEEMGLNMGDPVALSFKDLYDRYLEKQRIVTIKDGAGRKTQRRLTDAELGATLVAQFEAVRKQIAESGFGSAPISPIDFLHNELRKAGYKTDEITGRTVTLNYQSGTPILTSRSANIRQRVNAVRGFNNGDVDVIILNQAGSTGLSLHAASKFKDKRKRHMIIVQAEKNIDTHMQMLGRVHRTGQVIPPAYSQMMADIPAEMRPAAVLMKKMASLNANTTASRKSSVTAEGVVDFVNDYGGQVAQEFLRDNPDVVEAIGGSKVVPILDDPSEASEDDIRKLTGYIPILPIKQQEQIYKDLIDRYNELIERENTLGTNKLEAKAVDLDAQILSTVQITEDKGDPSIFAQPASMEQVDVKRNVKPYTSAEVNEIVNERLGDKTAGAVANDFIKMVTELTHQFEREKIDAEKKKEGVDPVKIESQRAIINMTLGHVRAVLQNYQIGNSISIKDKNGFIIYGVITDIQNKGRTQNPAAGSAWKMTIALANGDAKSLTINFGQIGNRYELSRETRVNWYNAETQSAEMMNITDIFDKGSTVRREKRWMVTGNILAGFAKYPGQIIQYTKKDGTTGQGVLMNRQFDFAKEQKNQPVTLKSGAQVMQFIKAVGDGAMVGTPDGIFRMRFQNGRFAFVVPSSKREGGTYYLDNGITNYTGDFYKRGQQMVANTYDAEDAQAALDYIISEREESIVALSNADKAREMFAPKPKEGGVELNDIPSNLAENGLFTNLPEPERVNAMARLKSLERRAQAGKITDAEFRLGVAQVVADMQRKANARSEPKDLVRGPDWVRERLLRARRTNELPANVVDFALWLLDKNPALATDLAISLQKGGDNSPSGSYKSLARLVTLFKNNVNSGTAVHEILHHAERMMSGEVHKGVIREWQRAWDAAYRKGDAKTKEALVKLLQGGLGNKAAFADAIQAFKDGTLNYEEHYQLTNPSEYWAVNATRILSQRYGANTWQEKARQFLREMIEYMKGALGFRSDTQIMKGLRQVIKGDGSMVSSKMLVEQVANNDIKADPNKLPPTEFMDIRSSVQAALFKNPKTLRTFGWYDRSISTQLNKALKDADFAKVFGYVNAIQNEVSLTSLRAAELAPGYLPRITDVKAAAKTMVMGRKSGSAQAKASQAIFSGTLAGDTVMEGKVWTEEELRNNFGLDDTGVALYFQARAAIDASLDEVAAAEAYAMAQGFIPKAMRRAIIDSPQRAEALISASLEQQIKKLQRAIKAANDMGNEAQAKSLEDVINGYFSTAKQIEKIFTTSRNLKAAGYAPLMRFGKYTVTAQAIDAATGNLIRDEEGNSITMFFGKYETEGEAQNVLQSMQAQYAGRDDVKISAGVSSEAGYELYSGISPETLALFAEALGADKVMKKYIQEALSERSALKRRLERKGVEGYTQDMPRVLANFITSNARHASKQYYMRDLNNAIKYIPKEKGDVKDEAIALKEFVLNAKDPGSALSAITFGWFLGGSVSSALVNMTQPIMMTGPYLSQFGVRDATTAMFKAMPIALGRKQITDAELRNALKRASQEGIVDAQEIFHLYSQGAQNTAAWLASTLAKVPGAGAKVKAGSESVRARASAFGVLWGSMFAAAEGFNRRLTFVAAWEVAKATGVKNPYAFAVRAVNETQGIFNKANRPNWARGGLGRMVFTFKQYSIMYVELVKRMATKGGPEGKRAALIMLATLLLLSGEEGLPFSQDLADIIDTIGQFLGYDTNMLRSKRELAHKILGEQLGDFALYGLSSFLPVDFQGRLGLGNLIPGTGMLKKSNTAMESVRSIVEIAGPTASIGTQVGDAAEAASEENYDQARRNLAPKAVKDLMMGLDMLDKGYAVDAAGNKKVNTTPADAYIKMLGFNPTVVAQKNRSQMVERQDINLQKETESSIVKQMARALSEGDKELEKKADRRLENWNKSNPNTPIVIKPRQIKDAMKNMASDSDARLIKRAPREMRGRVADNLSDDTTSDD